MADRCAVVGGSFFEAVSDGGDVYLLKSIVHDWDDAQATTILRACRRAMGPAGRGIRGSRRSMSIRSRSRSTRE